MTHISKEVSDKADELAWLATFAKPGQLKTFIIHAVPKPSVSRKECLQVEEIPLRWRKEILDYLKHEILPADKSHARKIRTLAARYTLVIEKLYIRGFSSPLLKCLD